MAALHFVSKKYKTRSNISSVPDGPQINNTGQIKKAFKASRPRAEQCA